jgi:hypothetical protein
MEDSQNLHWKSARFSRGVKSERVSRVVANSAMPSACSIGEHRTEKMLRATTAIDLKMGAMFARLDSKKRL